MRTPAQNTNPEQTHSGRDTRRRLDVTILIHHPQQCGNRLRRVLEVSSDETVNFFLDTRACGFCPVPHQKICQLFNVQFPYLFVPTPLDKQILNLNKGSCLLGREPAERFLNYVALWQFTANPIQSPSL